MSHHQQQQQQQRPDPKPNPPQPQVQAQPPYQTHRAASTLLIPHRQALAKAKPSKANQNQILPDRSAHALPRTTRAPPQTNADKNRRRATEVNLAAAPQPLLDPVLWSRMQERAGTAAGSGSGADGRRGEGSGYGYGRMAVRGRMGGLGRGREG
ncbi:uncharacterized protein ACLA_091050 [Aspergillus clavatus NRRL 1]|uniref:Uncharacterized protein n=1 Tax=Aspergillus clavatus (strain ATCC 1007 / CBS 513.65 / DSM 816 / NCTC 3887 / NRRL 1 / QM 1276 / 107) TaxID=344612 RepID=A1CEV8_ASPCL|nr:uncharacterized protein ACLA_091050 [Aspergillus clavatus NRRL 1]EAW11407.1 conserved hypothetical protein [Aspergillus clavatus NRRL 1]